MQRQGHRAPRLHWKATGQRAACTQAELLLRCDELRDGLWELCDKRAEEADAERIRLGSDASATEHVALAVAHFKALVQVEMDR